ncbi:endonuclease/exonuclease/phosphatase family protein [Thiorhodovibrio frisius]|uniref:endonuclease/exonuclease/phosphatase family protein n=1 Tax=Thiorhodovibrio frisius TaxID=631362 RepID=UPI00022C679F|nr:endonuclease/exonuclease/phosphatase family protein [Thiorhodovibrio frisius]WPL23281.1 hypothetical protein Thiofri_03466 [Thiorhodovibrio frisius]
MPSNRPSLQAAREAWQYRGQTRPPFAQSPGPDQESVWDYPCPPIKASILAGDLNASPWSSAFAGLSQTEVRRASGLQPTWPAVGQGWFGIPIDQVLVTTAWWGAESGSTRSLGSDHRARSVLLW